MFGHEDLVSEDLPLRDILDLTFRVNPAYRLIEHEDLPSGKRAYMEGLAEDPEYFGLLVAADKPELGVLAVNTGSASLLSSLRTAGDLPAGSRDPFIAAGLVLDGILEVEWNGRFVTGPAACYCLFTEIPEEPEAVGRTSTLSFRALKLAQELPADDPKVISSYLYNYNFLPMSPIWARRFSTSEQINNVLGLQSGGLASVSLQDNYISSELPGWRSWQSLTNELTVGESEPTFKLYISPYPGALSDAFPIAARCLAEFGVSSFKLGRDAFGLLRSDKFVVYFSDYNTLEDLSLLLAVALDGCPAHGVPFSAAITEDGLLSWGMDPPRSDQIAGWQGVESWRVWITNRLARSILRARVLNDRVVEPWHYALLRLRLDGVLIQTWLPSGSIWTD